MKGFSQIYFWPKKYFATRKAVLAKKRPWDQYKSRNIYSPTIFNFIQNQLSLIISFVFFYTIISFADYFELLDTLSKYDYFELLGTFSKLEGNFSCESKRFLYDLWIWLPSVLFPLIIFSLHPTIIAAIAKLSFKNTVLQQLKIKEIYLYLNASKTLLAKSIFLIATTVVIFKINTTVQAYGFGFGDDLLFGFELAVAQIGYWNIICFIVLAYAIPVIIYSKTIFWDFRSEMKRYNMSGKFMEDSIFSLENIIFIVLELICLLALILILAFGIIMTKINVYFFLCHDFFDLIIGEILRGVI